MLLVTGGSGLLGANFALTAQQRGYEVAAVYHRHAVRLPQMQCFQADLTDQATAYRLVQNLRPTWIIHCAAESNIDRCQEYPDEARQLNVNVPRFLAEAAADLRAGFIYISTDAVFDGKAGNYSEEQEPIPINIYAETKLAGEKAVTSAGGRHMIVRTNMYGWNAQPKTSQSEWFLQKLQTGQPVPGFADVFFNPLLVNDLSEVLLEMMERELTGIYNVGSRDHCSKYEFARELALVFGLDPDLVQPVSVQDVALKAPRAKNVTLDVSKLAAALGRPLPGLGEGLRRCQALQENGFAHRLKDSYTPV